MGLIINFFKMIKIRKFFSVFVLGISGLSFVSCVDSSYDMSKDIDLTMGLGSNGLALKLGNTENIFLKDILEIDNSEIIDTTANGLYYLEKTGNTSLEEFVNPMNFSLSKVDLSSDVELINYEKLTGSASGAGVPLSPADSPIDSYAEGNSSISFDIDGQNDVRYVHTVVPSAGSNSYRISMNVQQSSGLKFGLKSVKNLKVIFPDEIFFNGLRNTHVMEVADMNFSTLQTSFDLPPIYVDSLVSEETPLGLEINPDGTASMNKPVKMVGDFEFALMDNCVFNESDHVNVVMTIYLGSVDTKTVTGVFDPKIEPEIEPMEISEDLPDFLKDEEVTLKVKNPTFYVNVEGNDLPLPCDFSGTLRSYLDGAQTGSVRIPANGEMAAVEKHTNTSFYFSQEDTPWDYPSVDGGAKDYVVENLSSLIEKIPDYIEPDFRNGQIKAQADRLNTLELGRYYRGNISYKVLVPFQFNENLVIVYNDSIDDMNDDLRDYEADGILITADAVNTIPLDLDMEVTPLDLHGNRIDELVVTTTRVNASSSEEAPQKIEIDIVATQRSAVSRLEKLLLRIKSTSPATGELYSGEYLRLSDIRLRLKGQIVGNFN